MTGEEAAPGSAVPEDAVPEDAVPGGVRPDDDGSGADPAPREDTVHGGEPVRDGDSAPDGNPAPDGEPSGGAAGLSDRDREILALENLQWKYQGAKEMEIRRRLNLSPTHYYQRLNVLIDTRAALEHDPMLVTRLRRQRGDLG